MKTGCYYSNKEFSLKNCSAHKKQHAAVRIKDVLLYAERMWPPAARVTSDCGHTDPISVRLGSVLTRTKGFSLVIRSQCGRILKPGGNRVSDSSDQVKSHHQLWKKELCRIFASFLYLVPFLYWSNICPYLNCLSQTLYTTKTWCISP